MQAFSYTTKDANGQEQTRTIDLANATDQTGTNADGSNFTYKTATAVDAGGAAVNPARTMYVFDTEEDWAAAMGQKQVGDNDIVPIKENGNIVLGEQVSSSSVPTRRPFLRPMTRLDLTKGNCGRSIISTVPTRRMPTIRSVIKSMMKTARKSAMISIIPLPTIRN